jgi:acylphosphatase
VSGHGFSSVSIDFPVMEPLKQKKKSASPGGRRIPPCVRVGPAVASRVASAPAACSRVMFVRRRCPPGSAAIVRLRVAGRAVGFRGVVVRRPAREISLDHWQPRYPRVKHTQNFMTARKQLYLVKKIRVVVSRTIQNVGYRAKVITIARVLGLTGFVQNLDDGRVRIIAESEDGDLDRFIDAIRIKNTLIDVEDVEVEYADATGDFADFYKLVGGGETDERLDKAAEYLKKLIDVTESGFSGITSEVREMRTEMKSGFENLDSKMNMMIDETRGLREDMKSHMDRKFGEIDDELSTIKSALKASGMLS